MIKFFKELGKKDTDIAGGKGASLGEMTNIGLRVPEGFVILSSVFDEFLQENDIKLEIDLILEKIDTKEVHVVDDASKKIEALILNAEMSKKVEKEIVKAFKKMDSEYVAVRSSATAEDGIDAAWAGQLDSFLNTSEKKLLENIKRCWASLFTSRAIFYRFEQKLHTKDISVAVVVQKMIDSEVSGIAFSVHPVTEDYNQMIIEASFGLGEAIVSGQVTPDSYVVTKKSLKIIDKNVFSQTRGMYRANGGGNEWLDIEKNKGEKQVLSDEMIVRLSREIIKIEKHYAIPQDIEWGIEDGEIYIVQSRPITTLVSKELDVPSVAGTDAIAYERAFGGPGMPFLVSDIGVDIYVRKVGFVAIKSKDIWTCYIPEDKKKMSLEEGEELFSDKEKYEKYKKDYSDFMDDFENQFKLIINRSKIFDSGQFKDFIKLCRKSEVFYLYTQYFFTDLLPIDVDKSFESDFNELKERGRSLLNDQYFSKDNYLDQVLKRASRVVGFKVEDLYHYFCSEIVDLLDGKNVGNFKIGDREIFYTYFSGNKVNTLTGQEAKNKISVFLKLFDKDDQKLVGTIASRGKATARVRVLDQGFRHKNISKFVDAMQDGEILVAETTSPEIMAACKKASAIVTNQGGLLSHAAIVSRELGIPCIVGVDGATIKLKNGDKVEVDAVNGVVRKIS